MGRNLSGDWQRTRPAEDSQPVDCLRPATEVSTRRDCAFNVAFLGQLERPDLFARAK